MNIYLLKRLDHGPDHIGPQFYSAVVIAANEDEARCIHPGDGDPAYEIEPTEVRECIKKALWPIDPTDENVLSVEFIGNTDLSKSPSRVVLAAMSGTE